MKKLSVLIALALVLTIGGAYATWTFATSAVTETNATVSNIGIGMTVVEDGSMGTLTATFENYGYSIAPGDGNVPTLRNDKEDAELVITFTTAANAQDTIKKNGVTVFVDLSVGTAFTNPGNASYTAVLGTNTTHGLTINAGTGDGKGDWATRTDNGNGTVTFTYTITSNTVMEWMKINNANALTNLEAATAYKGAVDTGRYTIKATTTNPNP